MSVSAGGTRPNPIPDLERRHLFEQITSEVYEPLQRYLGRRASFADADEALDDVLLVIWRRLESIPVDDAVPWAFGVARRVLANQRRSGQRRQRLAAKLAERGLPAPTIEPPSSAEHPEVVAALQELGRRDREVVYLWAWEQLTPREIAVVLGTTANAVSVRLSRAKRRLESILRKSGRGSGHVMGRGPGGVR